MSVSPLISLRVAPFPHEAYVARCACLPDVGEIPTTNYHGHTIGAPRCRGCGRRFELDEALMSPSTHGPAAALSSSEARDVRIATGRRPPATRRS